MSTHTGAGARGSITAVSDDLQQPKGVRFCSRTTLISILSAGKLENENGRYPPGKTGDGSTGSLSLARIGIIITDIYPVKREYTIGGGRIESHTGCKHSNHYSLFIIHIHIHIYHIIILYIIISYNMHTQKFLYVYVNL